MSNNIIRRFSPRSGFKMLHFKKIFSLLCNLSLFLNVFLPYFATIPALATDTSSFYSRIEYLSASNRLDITTNSSDKIEYQLFYKTVDKIDSITGIDLDTSNKSEAFYLGTCTADSVCLPQNVNRGVLKTKSLTGQIFSQFFTLENNILTIVKEGDSFEFDLSDEENNFLSPWTFEKVEINKEYISPENSGVKLTFIKLPSPSGNIKIEEITLTKEQIEQTGSLSDKAYDITSDMVDGTFSYNLSLPIPESSKGKDVDIKFTESISEIDTAQIIKDSITTNTSVSVNNVDHFTVFVVTNPLPTGISNGGSCTVASINGICYDTIQGAINVASIGDTINLASDIKTTSQININKSIIFEGNNHTIYPQFSKTSNSNNSVITIYVGEVNINNLIIDGTDGTNLHGINLYTVNNIHFDSVTVSYNDYSGITINGSALTVKDLITFGNGWGGVDIDQGSGVSTPASLTVGGTSSHTESAAIWMDDYHKAVSLIDTNHQYEYADYGDVRVYTLDTTTPSVPVLTWPINGTFTNDNTPLMQWDDVAGATGYYYRVKYNCADINNSATCTSLFPNSTGLWSSFSEYQAGKTNDGVYYWQVQACNSTDNCSNWSDLSKTIIDTNPPSTPSNLNYSTTNGTVLGCGGITNQYTIVAKWNTSADTNFSHYEYKSFNPTTGWVYNGGNIGNNTSRTGTFSVGEGTYGFAVRAVDKAGNFSNWTSDNLINSCQITYDATPPSVAITTPMEGYTLKGIVDISGTVTEENPHHYWLAIYRKSDGKEIYSNVVNHSGSINGLIYSWNTLGLNDGEYQIKFAERDAADNRSTDFIVNVMIDNTPPIITVNPYVTNDKTPILTGTINDNSATISVKIGTNTFPATNIGTGNWILDTIASNVADGTYDVIATATDTVGNIGTDSTTNELTIDSVAPNALFQHYIDGILFTDPIAYTNNLSKLTFTAEYTDITPSSGLLKDSYVIFDAQDDHSFKFSQNGAKSYCSWRKEPNLVTGLSGDNYSLTTPENFSNCISSLADGEYYMTHQVYDNAIRQDIPSITQFRDVLGLHFIIDTIDPESIITFPESSSSDTTIYLNAWNGSITGTATDNLSGVNNVEISIKNSLNQYFNGTNFDSSTEILLPAIYTDGNWSYNAFTSPPEDTYTIKSHAIDNAGNMENTYTLTIVLDKTISEVAISLNPTVGDASNGWYKTQPEVTLTHTDANFDKIEYSWNSDTGPWTTYSAPFKLQNEGASILYYRAVDKAQNISQVGIKNIAWDQTDLEYGPQNISADPNPTSGSTSKIKWEFAKDNIGIDKYEIQWSLDGINYSKTVGSGTTEVEVDKLTEGNWNVKVVAFDQSGRSKDGSINLQVDRTGPTAPTLSLTGTTAGTATLSWNANADAKDYIIWYGNAPGSRLYGARVGNVTTYTVGGLGAGNYYFIVKAVDEAQNQGPESNEVNTGTIAGAV
ncbi:MAG: Ig-like domain-containing protein, partial [Candidatus Shapirobacteria bacterium]|nr:Ig-like domain-containing protein [Candidatus Shapirobacteria bacterium]